MGGNCHFVKWQLTITMADVRDVQPITPVWPKKSTTQKRRQQQPGNQQQKTAKKLKRDRYDRGHIDEFA